MPLSETTLKRIADWQRTDAALTVAIEAEYAVREAFRTTPRKVGSPEFKAALARLDAAVALRRDADDVHIASGNALNDCDDLPDIDLRDFNIEAARQDAQAELTAQSSFGF